jgi:signal transduction histidine kinase
MNFSDVTQVYIDKRQVMEAINNLISNAVDAMHDGGTLTIVTQDKVLRGKNYITIKITDTGCGISEENMLLIFEPFFSTKVTKKETGLGLPITKKIVEGHGGFLRIDSRAGKGSTFTLYFPYRAK